MTATLTIIEQVSRRKVGLSKLPRGTYLQVRVKRNGIDTDQTVLLFEQIDIPKKGPVRFTCLTTDGRFSTFTDKQVVGVLGTISDHGSLFKFPEPKAAPMPVVKAPTEQVQKLVRYGETDRLTSFRKDATGVYIVRISGLTGFMVVSEAKTFVVGARNTYVAAWLSPRNDIYSMSADTEGEAYHLLSKLLEEKKFL